jgi:NAD(P)-dependent dehydrogenase (short-subunit alcohol dehydrogenase family)
MQEIAIVTGAAKRIGRDIALTLAHAGFALAVHYNGSREEAEGLVRGIVAEGGQAKAFGADLADWDAASGLVDRVVAELGAPTLLVNCAALFLPDAAADFEQGRWRKQFAVNLEAPVLLSQAFAKAVPPGVHGAIVNIIDQRVTRPTPKNFSYTLAKSALWTATQTMAQAFAPRIRVNAIGPGPTFPNWQEGEQGLRREALNIPLEKSVSGQEIADAVLYLARAPSVTGVLLCVDGGQHLAWRTPDTIED